MSEDVIDEPATDGAQAVDNVDIKEQGSSEQEEVSQESNTEHGDNETSEDEDHAQDDIQERPKSKSRSKRQSDKLKALHRENFELRERLEKSNSSFDQASDNTPQAPKLEDFDDWDQYQEARDSYVLKKVLSEERAAIQAEMAQKEAYKAQRDRFEAFQSQVESFSKVAPDFQEVMSSASDIPISNEVRDLIYDSDKGAHIAYYLAKNPEIALDLNDMQPLQAAREVGRIEALLKQPKAKKQTQAPVPAEPVKGSIKPQADLGSMTMEEYAEFRKAQGL